MKTLIVVESPTKAETVARYAREVIPGEVIARACLGHLRDLPPGQLGVEVEKGFHPAYRIMPNREKTVGILRQAILQADCVLLATDPDREGEAVAWHVVKIFEAELADKIVSRVSFNAITRQAIHAALAFPTPIDTASVQAAVARRVLDRLVGYTISPRLWQAVAGQDHSAGRVQSVALRILVEHNRKQPDVWCVEIEL